VPRQRRFALAPVLCQYRRNSRVDRLPNRSGNDLGRSGAAASPGLVTDVARQSRTGTVRTQDQVVLRLKAMSEEAAHLASTLALRRPAGNGGANGRGERGIKSPEDALKLLIEIRRMRLRQFETPLFADPAWDMLLELVSARAAGRPVPVSSACVAAGVPATTALRLVNGLVEAGFVRRFPDPADRRRVLVDLTDDGIHRMTQFLRAVGRRIG
jgi:DNA-binding MarR family transcriptional regulator